ncbi:MAG: transcription antitermination factor NusB [Planctomycetes bacterium]|nr:transcription antitermination factor NusB [Planctomycetota bacterium]
MRPRSLARRLAMQYLYAYDLNNGECESADEFLAVHADTREIHDFALRLVEQALAQQIEIENALRGQVSNFELKRVAAVERNILRLGVCELFSAEVPFKVAIDEAVNLAKKFGRKDSGAFVNGILDAVAKKFNKTENLPGEGGN